MMQTLRMLAPSFLSVMMMDDFLCFTSHSWADRDYAYPADPTLRLRVDGSPLPPAPVSATSKLDRILR